jgi:hypothetical protein
MRRAYRPQSRFPDDQPPEPSDSAPGWTKQELLDAVEAHNGQLSGKTFDTIRKTARVSGPSHGGRNHVFRPEDVFALIHVAEGGRFTERGPDAAKAWRALLHEAGIRMPETISRARRK